MAQQYPIWNEVIDDTYKTSKNFGSRNGFIQRIHVGRSSKNTTEFCDIQVKKNNNIFQLYVDGKLIKEKVYE